MTASSIPPRPMVAKGHDIRIVYGVIFLGGSISTKEEADILIKTITSLMHMFMDETKKDEVHDRQNP